MNFYDIVVSVNKNGITEIAPDFQTGDKDSDLMVRGKNFYAIWDEAAGMWSTSEHDVQRIVDKGLYQKKVDLENAGVSGVKVRYMKSFRTRSWSEYKSYISQTPDRFKQLDDKLTFADTPVTKDDYVSKRLPYALKPADHSAYDELMDTLYSPENREKIEWAIGSILSGDSPKIEKFYVLYGKGGTGKGTVLKIIQKLFDGYCAPFRAQDLGNVNKDFSMESFKNNPLVAIDEDGNLNGISDSTRINSIVSHERILMNEKGKPHYPWTPHCVMFIGSNEPVKIKDEESGLIRRLIDIEPKNKKAYPIPGEHLNLLMGRVDFELGGIAYHCLEVYKKLGGRHYFDHYRPTKMMYRTNVFFNYIEDSYEYFSTHDGVSLNTAFTMWTTFCDKSNVKSEMQRQKFREELKNYFDNFFPVTRVNGVQVRSWYSGFKKNCLGEDIVGELGLPADESPPKKTPDEKPKSSFLVLDKTKSLLDEILKDCKAQYEDRMVSWDKSKTLLKDIDTSKVHFILPPEWILMTDFDLKNADGEKDQALNLEAASKWPETYAEYSKSGKGIHLYYRFTGNLDELKNLFADNVEIKVFHGKSAIRRKLTFCNDKPIATISSGLPKKPPKKEKKTMVDMSVVEFERYLTNCIRKAMRKEIDNCPSTKSSCDYIKFLLEQAWDSGKHYDVSVLRKEVYAFAMGSTNNKRYCTDLVGKMMWMSRDAAPSTVPDHHGTLVFFDCEVFPNVNMVNWKIDGDKYPVVRMINPTPEDINELLKYDLIGFNCRKYDNHIIHAIRIGYSPIKVYEISKGIIAGNSDCYFREAWDYSYTDILDFSSVKKSLKKFEIEMGFHHKELGMDWTKPVPPEKWAEIAEYCDNDVLATEALFHSAARQADWKARQILVVLANGGVS